MNQTTLLNKYLDRFYDLLKEINSGWHSSFYYGGPEDYQDLIAELEGLKANIISLLDQVLPADHAHRKWMDELSRPEDFSKGRDYYQTKYKSLYGRLSGLRSDFEKGMLGNLSLIMEAQIATAYLDQASQLLAEVERNDFKHVPAASIAGAVLERELRTICHTKGIATSKRDGLDRLIKNLADDFNEDEHEKLMSWKAIRNHAAHGHFDKFSKEEVEEMLIGLGDFFDKHLSDNQTTATASS